jgi:hypothetical protein
MPVSTRELKALCELLPLLFAPANAALSTYQSFLPLFRLFCRLTWFSAWEAATEKAEDFVSQLSTDKKIGIVSGDYRQPGPACVGQIGAIPRLNFTGVCYADGPVGFGRSDGVSIFSSCLVRRPLGTPVSCTSVASLSGKSSEVKVRMCI